MTDLSVSEEQRANEFWHQQLRGELPVLELPFDRPRTAATADAAPPVQIDDVRAALALPGLAAVAARHGTSVETVALAAYSVVLHRHTGQDEIVIGLALPGSADASSPIAPIAPIRLDLAARPAFPALLAQAHQLTVAAHDHARHSARAALDALGPRRTQPVFPAMFSAGATDDTAAAVDPASDPASALAFDLALSAATSADGIALVLRYDAALFARATAERLLATLSAVLTGIAADPDRRITELPLLTGAERARVVDAFNATSRPFAADRRLHDHVAAQADARPDAIAVVFEGRQLSYGELDARANALAARLQALGVVPDALVGLYLERSPELMVGMFGVLKAGGAYLPLDPTYPSDRLAFMLEDARVGVVISTPDHFGFLRDKYPRATLLDAAEFTAGPGTPVRPPCPADPANLAYAIYTSGSTGKPKGVMLPHAAITNFVSWQVRTYELGPGDRCLHFISPSFDVSGWEIFAALCSGATLVISRRQDPASLARLIHDERITFAVTMPSILESLMAEDAFRTAPALRRLTSGAEALSAALQDAYLALGRGELHNAGGPTETAIASVHWRCVAGSRVVPYGRPVDNTQTYVLDDDLAPVPIGVRGEMYIGGAGLARGFLNRPDTTAERFVPDPFSRTPGARMYRTGDHARWLPDGSLELLGRVDDQIKIRGFRIELGEVGDALARHPEVRESIVVARGATARDRRLIGYAVGRTGRLDPRELRAWMRARLPEYMVPSAFVVLDAMPHLPNGKLDKNALPAPVSTAVYVAPRTAEERQLAEVWQQLLGVERVGADDHFFELGGHSLMATQLVSRLRDALGVELPLRAVFEAPTVAELARAIAGTRAGDRAARTRPAPPLVPAARGGELALSFAQQRLWFLDQYETETPFYNEPLLMQLSGALDLAALERSVNAVIARHESLRTTFAVSAGRPHQVIHPAKDIAIARIDVGHAAPAEREAEVRRLATIEARRPFDLARGPVVRLAVFAAGAHGATGEHWLLFVMHHIAGDDWSLAVFWNELAECYRAFTAGAAPALPPLAIQYADFAAWQRDYLSDSAADSPADCPADSPVAGELARQLGYWKSRLDGAPGLIDLPTDRPRPSVASHRGAVRVFELGAPLSARLTAVARELSATPFMVLLAAFQTLLHRYTRQDEIVTGTVVANRNRAETEPLIGFFVNTLVCRTDLSGAPTFRELVGRVREVALGAYDHQDVPFERLVEELAPRRSLGHAPLFQVLFVLQNAPAVRALPGIAQRVVDLDIGIAKFDLTLYLEERAPGPADGGGLRGRLEYATDLFDDATIARMAGHLQRLLEGIAADPGQRITAIPMLTDAERRELVVDWNATQLDYPRDARVHDLLERQAAATPDAIALQFGAQRVTYRELDARTTQLAHYLRGRGIGPDVLVAIFAERSIEMVVGMIAVHKAGGAYVPLDPNYPEDRIAFIQDDTRSPVVLTQDRLVPRLPAGSAQVVRLDADWPEIARAPTVAALAPTTARHLSHIIYTSGSTGRPKGVAIEHRSVVSFCCWARGVFTDDERAGVLFSTSICFDLSVFELFATLAWGGRVILVENVLALAHLPADAGVVLVNTVPSAMATLLKTSRLPASVTTVNLAGEPLKNALVAQLYATGTVQRVYDLYGPSETTTYSTFTRRIDGAPPSIGRPLANTQVYLLDPAGGLAPRGVAGEIFIAGDGVARGYLGRPELTDERFVPDPFGADPRGAGAAAGPGRMYRTGDLGRWLPDGTLEYRGRIDHQVKIRGFRIELGEIEAVLARQKGVREATAIVREDVADDPRIVAYLAGGPELAATSELKVQLKAVLPEHMVPSAFVVLDALPQTPNGKVDRKALLQIRPDHQRAEDRAMPATATERQIARIFEDLLGVPAIGARDGFFELGGHSLLATQVMSRIRDGFGVELPLRRLFERPTVEELAGLVDAAGAAAPAGPAIARVPRGGELALSFAQQRLWFLDRLEPDSPFYNLPLVVRLRGELDLGRLERSLQAIVDRHEALRTTFDAPGGRAVQVIAPALALALAVTDLGGLAADDREAEATWLAIAEARRPFDLARGPLVRARVLRLAEREHWLVLGFHHIISDGWSLEVLWRELAAHYAALATGRLAELPPLAIQYADFAAWQRDFLSGPAQAAQLAYWRTQLQGAPARLELPTDRPRPPVMGYRGQVHGFDIPEAVTAQIKALGRRESATLFMTLIAAFQALLHRYSGQTDILVGTPVANRSRAETEPLIGFFVNTVVLRGDASGDPSFRALLARVREAALGAYSHADVPFDKLVEELRPERSASYAPLFQVMFDLTTAAERAALPGLDARPIELDGGIAKFDLGLAIEDRGAAMRGVLDYNTDLYDAQTIERMAGHFVRLLAAVAADPAQPLSRLPLVGDAERRRVVVELNATAADYPQERIALRFERQAAAAPDRTAVVFEGRSLGYGELDARANQLARHLQGLGVGPEVLVGIAMERSLELVVAQIAILKAGGAYVPFDPSYPRDRLEFMLGDARPSVIVMHDRLRETLPTGGATVVAIDAAWPQIARQPATPLGAARAVVQPDNRIYILYTSGSTGRPKGAITTHAGTENHLSWMARELDFGPGDRVLQQTSLGFDASIYELVMPLLHGACTVMARPDGHQDPSYLVDLVRRERVTLIQFVPSMLGMFLEAAGADGCTDVRHALVGGEPLPHHLVARFRDRLPGAVLHNMYGLTEAAVDSTHWRCGAGEPAIAPIGRPIGNAQIYVLDRHLEPAPIGVTGEIYVGGVGVARGYLDRPALTAERFIPDPFSATPGRRLYRTGDLGRVRSDGAVEFVGRIDHQVKLRGFRIELGEIEAEIALHPAVREVAVAIRDDARVGPQLVAYIVGDPGAALAAQLRPRLEERLPAYMVPSVFVALDALPLSPNGKVDRRALPAPDASADAGVPDAAPRTPSELAIAQIFGELLGLASVGPQASFFALGGHSLLAVRLFAQIEARLGVALPVATVFRAPTVEALAREVDSRPDVAPSPLVVLRSGGTRAPLICVHPIGGSVLCYQPLIARLAPDRPCFGLEAQGLAGGAAPRSSIAEMAEAYAAAVQGACPDGPLHLLGWSFGGLVALELARRLADAGRDIASITLLDSYAPASDAAALAPTDALALLARDLGLAVSDDALAGLTADAALAGVAELAHAAGILPAHLGAAYLGRRLAVLMAHLAAEQHYTALPPPGRAVVALIRARDAGAGGGVDPAATWRGVLPAVTVLDAPGDHFAMVQPPCVDELAGLVDGILGSVLPPTA